MKRKTKGDGCLFKQGTLNFGTARASSMASHSGREGAWFRGLVAVAYNFGLRRGELLSLTVGAV